MRELLQTSLRSVACQSHSPPFSDSDRSGSNPPPVRQHRRRVILQILQICPRSPVISCELRYVSIYIVVKFQRLTERMGTASINWNMWLFRYVYYVSLEPLR